MQRWRWKDWTRALLIWLCAWSAQAVEPAREPLVAMRVETAKHGQAVFSAVTSGNALHRGDLLRLEIIPLRPAYLHVIHVAPSGKAALLHSSGDKRRPRGQRLRLPAAGEVYLLDDERGQELLVVIASELALPAVSAQYANVVRSVQERQQLPDGAPLFGSVRSAGAGAPTAALEPTPGIHDLMGPLRGFDSAQGAVFGFADATGVAIATFRFNHLR